MNYYVEMIKEFVQKEISKDEGKLLDDGEYMYACGLTFQRLLKGERKQIVSRKKTLLLEISTFRLFQLEMLALFDEYGNNIERFSKEDHNLFTMVKEYEPQGTEIDSTLHEVIEEAFNLVVTNNPYERQERYSKKAGLVSKTYKLNQSVVEEFAKVCKERGVSQGPTLTNLMQQFIEEK